MKVLALDVATHVGLAVGNSNGQPLSWCVYLGDPPNGRRFSQIQALTEGLIRDNKPDLVVIEGAIGGPKASAYLIGLVANIEGVLWGRGVRYEIVNLGSVRKHFLGKALGVRDFPHMSKAAAKKAIKQEVIKRCELLGWRPKDDDAADAMAIWDFACAHFAKNYQPAPLGGLFQERNEA